MATLTITWTPVSPAPINGYLIRYWPQNNPQNVTTVTPNPTTSPVVITGVLDNVNYTGTIQSVCEGGSASTPTYFGALTDPGGDGCLNGSETGLSATGLCGSPQTQTFTLVAGYTATVTVNGFFYTGSGTRVATAELLDNNDNIIQSFTYTQTGLGQGTVTPASYLIATAGQYKIRANAISCSNGSGNITISVGNCQLETPGGGETPGP